MNGTVCWQEFIGGVDKLPCLVLVSLHSWIQAEECPMSATAPAHISFLWALSLRYVVWIMLDVKIHTYLTLAVDNSKIPI